MTKYPRLLETVYRTEFEAEFPDFVINYNSNTQDMLHWLIDVNTVISNWGAWGMVEQLRYDIDRANIPSSLREWLISRFERGERIDHTTAQAGFVMREVDFSGRHQRGEREIVKCHHIHTELEAYGNRSLYAIVAEDGTITTRETWYDIGD